jgi:hypothetical protein
MLACCEHGFRGDGRVADEDLRMRDVDQTDQVLRCEVSTEEAKPGTLEHGAKGTFPSGGSFDHRNTKGAVSPRAVLRTRRRHRLPAAAGPSPLGALDAKVMLVDTS